MERRKIAVVAVGSFVFVPFVAVASCSSDSKPPTLAEPQVDANVPDVVHDATSGGDAKSDASPVDARPPTDAKGDVATDAPSDAPVDAPVDAAYCSDGMKDGDETDTDCGGPTCNTPCADTKQCMSASDCI